MMQQTLILLKPDAIRRKLTEEILDVFISSGFYVVEQRSVLCEPSMICAHYEDNIKKSGDKFKEKVIKYYENQIIIAVTLVGRDAVCKVRKLGICLREVERQRELMVKG